MAGRSWNRNNGPGYVGPGYMGQNTANMGGSMGYYGRPMYTPSPMAAKPYVAGYNRNEDYRRPREDYRGGKRPRGKSPVGDKRPHHDSYGPRKDNRINKRQQSSGRYEVKVPKMRLNIKSATLPELKLMHHNLVIPSDFSKACFSWQDAYPTHEPMQIATKTDIYILHRDVESQVTHPENAFDVTDSDYSYSVRVMLMASPELGELYKNTIRTADEQNASEKTSVSKNLYFLVGGRTKTETMGIGGPWSPSLDGENPDTNPQTLINTAVRTFKSFTGVDLSSVTEWVRFMEIRYYRGANTKAATMIEEAEEREITEDKQEVVVFLMPNVTHLVPSESDWEKTKQAYADALQALLTPPEVEKVEDHDTDEKKDEIETSQAVDTTLDESQEIADNSSAGEPTHYSKLDVNTMKVSDLRTELAARNLDIKGVKANLVTRLQTSLEEEKNADVGEAKPEEEEAADEAPTKPADTSSQLKEEPKEITEKDRRRLERLYRLGDKPAILVYPNRAARGGRFDCHRVSLHSLLNYQSEEQKEHNFEVSLFAEQFHEMLQRDCAFNIFKAIYSAPEKDAKDVKSEENCNSKDEPDNKRRRNDSESSQVNDDGDGNKARRLRRSIDLHLLFSFTFFDSGHSNFVRDYDLVDILHLLDLGYSKSQMKKMVAKVTSSRDHVRYRSLTDHEITEGDDKDVATLKSEPNDPEFLRDLAAGNDILFGGEKPQVASKALIVSSDSDGNLLKRLEGAEEAKKLMEFQFFQIKDELEKTRIRLNACKDTEEKLRNENKEFQIKLRDEQKASRDNKILVSTYNHLLRHSRDMMSNAVGEIDKQFEKEKAKRDAEKAAIEAEQAKLEAAKEEKTEDKDNCEKTEEKEWEVVDQV